MVGHRVARAYCVRGAGPGPREARAQDGRSGNVDAMSRRTSTPGAGGSEPVDLPFHERLGRTIERVYGLPRGPFGDPQLVYEQAMERYLATRSYDAPVLDYLVRQFERRDDVFRASLEHGTSTPTTAPATGFLLDAVLVAVPFRHEAVWVELEPPCPVWRHDEGWRLLRSSLDGRSESDPAGERQRRFEQRAYRAWWLHGLWPGHDQFHRRPDVLGRPREQLDTMRARDAYRVWLGDLGAPTADDIAALWAGSERRGCAEALFALWAAFFLDAPGLLIDVLDATEDHPSAAVRSARPVVHEAQWGSHPDWLLDHVRAQRRAFLALADRDTTAR